MKQYKRNGWKRIFTIMTVLVLVLTSVDVTAFASRVPAQEQASEGEYTAEAIAEPLAQASGSAQPDTCSSIAGNNLTGRAKELYDEIKPKIKAIVENNGGSTKFQLYPEISYWTSEEGNKSWREDLKKLLNALLADCPYEMYWYSLDREIYYTSVDANSGYTIVYDLDFPVVTEYALNNSIYNEYILGKDNSGKRYRAIIRAKGIVEDNKNNSFLNRIQEYNKAVNACARYEEPSSNKLNDGILDVLGESLKNAGALGYARAFQYLCNIDGGITCYTVTGNIKGYVGDDTTAAIDRKHAWNIVSFNGDNYLVDVCNCGYDSNDEAAWGYPNLLVMKGVKEITPGKEYEAEFEKDGKTYRIVYTYDADTQSTFTKEQLTLTSESYRETEITDESVSITDSDATTYDSSKIHNVEIRDSDGRIMPSDSYNLDIKKDGKTVTQIKDAGKYEIIVTGKQGYSNGNVKKEFTIARKRITPTISGSAAKVYDGTTSVKGSELRISFEGVCAGDNLSYTVTYNYEDSDAGEDKLIIASDIKLNGWCADNYELAIPNPTTKGSISKAEPDIAFVEGSGYNKYYFYYSYSGEEIPNPKEAHLKLKGAEYNDLTFTWYKGSSDNGELLDKNPVNAGTYYLTISVPETKNYISKTIGHKINITRRYIRYPVIIINQDTYQYDGSEKKPEVTVKENDRDVIIPADEYSVSYNDNIKAGQATVNIIGNDDGNYEMLEASKQFTITPFDLTGLKAAVDANEDLTYTGDRLEPKAVVKTGFATLVPGKDYTMTYTDNTGVGTASFTVMGKGNYTGQISGTFEIAVGEFTGEELYNGKEEVESLYYSKTVDITAKETEAAKYSVSDSLDIDSFSKEYTFKSDKEGSQTRKLYFRNTDTGRIYQKDITVNFDNTAPTGKIKVDAKLWDRFLEIISFGHYRAASRTVTIEADDTLSGVSNIEYLIANKQMTLDELRASELNYTLYDNSNKPVLKENENQIVYVKLTDNVGNITYLSSDGIVLDTTAPVISDIHAVSGEDWTDTQFKFEFTVNEEGAYYYTVLPATKTAPDAAGVMKAAMSEGSGSAGSGTVNTLEAGKAVISRLVTGLVANTEYKIYIVAQDKVYNISTTESEPNISEVAAGDIVTTKKAAPVVEEMPEVSGMYGTKTSKLSITGGKVTAGGVSIDGSWRVSDTQNSSTDKLLPVGTTETCKLIFTPEDTDYPVREATVTPVITPRPVKLTINPASRAYKSENPEFTYKVAEEAGFEQIIEGDNLGVVLTTTADITSHVGSYDITGTAANTNYSVTITGGLEALTITKAESVPAVTDVVKSYVYTSGSKGNTEIIDLSKEMNFPEDCTDAVCQLTTAKDDDKLLGSAQTSKTTLQYSVNAVDKECIGKTAFLKVTIQMADYEDTTYELTIKITEQKDVAGSVNECEELTYGQKLGASKLTGAFTESNNADKSLKGTIEWKNPEEQLSAGVTEAEWIFTPSDTDYKSLSGKTRVTVKKAVPKVTENPQVSELEYNPDTKLADIKLNGGKAVNPYTDEELTAGEWSWENPDVVSEAGNSGYKLIYTPADMANYTTAEVTLKIPVKKAVPVITTLPAAKELTYGQTLSDSSLTGGGASTAGAFSWVSNDIRPEVKDSNITEYDVVFTPEDSVKWETASAKLKVKVSPKTLMWDAGELRVLNKMQDGSKEAELAGELKLSGMLEADNPQLGDVKLTAAFDTPDAGADKKVTISIEEAVLNNENYKLPDDNILVLSGTIEETNALAVQPALGKAFRLVMGGRDIVEVTSELADVKKDNILLNSPDNIIKYLKKLLIECKDDGKLTAEENMAVYEVLLLHSLDNINWSRVTTDNFPTQGVKVTLPYPQGTNGEDYQFYAVHMFTENRIAADGKTYSAGAIETPALALTQDGITMTLNSLSPIAFFWEKLDNNNNSSGDNDSKGDAGQITDGKGDAGQIADGIGDTAVTVEQGTATGDNSKPVLWCILAIIGILGICAVIIYGRKHNKNR